MMFHHLPLVAVTIALLLLPAAPAAAQDRLAITSVTVVDVDEGVLHRNQTVIVSDDRITAVGDADAVELPAGGVVIDGRGNYLIPGLWDMHAHASRGGRAARFWPLFVAHGVTGMRDTGSYADSLLYWRARSEHPAAAAPRIEIVSPSLTGDSPTPLPGMGGPFEIRVADAASAVAVVDSLAELGLHVIKVYDGLPREAYFAVAERTRELGMSFIGHVPLSVSLAEASDAGQKSFEHVADVWASCVAGGRAVMADFAWASARHGPASDSALVARERLVGALAFSDPDPAECGPLLERMEANGTWLTPTLTVLLGELQPRRFDGDPRMRWVPDSLRERWNARPRMPAQQEAEIGRPMLANAERAVAIAHDAGVPILAGSDASDMPYIFAGSSLHDELALLVEAGLTPLEALQTATLNPARFLKRTDDLGIVEVGKLADLVMLDANPLEDIANTKQISAVVLRGRYLDREALDGLLADAERAAQEPLPANAQQEHRVEGHGPEVTVYLPGLRHPHVDADAEDRIVEEEVVTVADSLVEEVRDRIESEVTPLLRELVDAGLVYKAELRQRAVAGERQEIRLVVTYPPVTVSPDARSEAARRAGGEGWLADLPGEGSAGVVSIEAVAGLTDRQLQRRAAEIHASHVAASIADARERGMSAVDQGRRTGAIFSRSKGQRRWGHASHWLAFHALAKVADAPYEIEYGDAAFTLRSRSDRLQRFLTMYGSNMDEYMSWLRGMHEAIGATEWYTMTAELDGDWLVETYRDHPSPDLVPVADLRTSPPTPAEVKRYVGTYLLTATTGDPSIQWELSIREEAGVAWVRWHHAGERPGRGLHLLALGDGTFAPGWYTGAGTAQVLPSQTLRFTGDSAGPAAEVEFRVANDEETVLFRFQRHDP